MEASAAYCTTPNTGKIVAFRREPQTIARIRLQARAAECDGAHMPKPPRHKPPALPKDVALQLADWARVPDEQRESFYDLVCWTVRLVWERDRRALGSKSGAALVRAAQAAGTLPTL